MTTYLVSAGTGYTVRGRFGDEVHCTETDCDLHCCDRGCALRTLEWLGVPLEVVTDHPLGHGAGDFIDLRETDARDDSPVYSWGEDPCPDASWHEYCPACGALVVEGSQEESEPMSYVDPPEIDR